MANRPESEAREIAARRQQELDFLEQEAAATRPDRTEAATSRILLPPRAVEATKSGFLSGS
ncbi:hypothetical protein Pa4123_67330 [Phytohabitans aurantiacus]|uniref:Uncharacterized protein n=1 Tax=Phytohabitans aurantiacus TaxID=3016789 RepID=A0ABQ5R3T7_9ACTN|nr:hypothetical protein Pa4123_67330 [Phytohabitans aurantiacus]